ncbi:hypothetical protein NUG23_32105, partial [Streptomyces sp. PAL114]|nr:hypothetical protein [Streptomyces sp. PAL114]
MEALLSGLFRDGPDGEAEHTDPAVFGEDGYGVLLVRSPGSLRELAATVEACPMIESLPPPRGWSRRLPTAWPQVRVLP